MPSGLEPVCHPATGNWDTVSFRRAGSPYLLIDHFLSLELPWCVMIAELNQAETPKEKFTLESDEIKSLTQVLHHLWLPPFLTTCTWSPVSADLRKRWYMSP